MFNHLFYTNPYTAQLLSVIFCSHGIDYYICISPQEVSTCNIGQMLEVDTPLDVPFPLLSLEQQVPFKSILYTEYQVNGSHFLFLGTENGRLLQVRFNSLYSPLICNFIFVPTGM